MLMQFYISFLLLCVNGVRVCCVCPLMLKMSISNRLWMDASRLICAQNSYENKHRLVLNGRNRVRFQHKISFSIFLYPNLLSMSDFPIFQSFFASATMHSRMRPNNLSSVYTFWIWKRTLLFGWPVVPYVSNFLCMLCVYSTHAHQAHWVVCMQRQTHTNINACTNQLIPIHCFHKMRICVGYVCNTCARCIWRFTESIFFFCPGQPLSWKMINFYVVDHNLNRTFWTKRHEGEAVNRSFYTYTAALLYAFKDNTSMQCM